MNALFLFFALLGHAFLWIGLLNRLHALGIRRKIVRRITYGAFSCAAIIPLGIGWYNAFILEPLCGTAALGCATLLINAYFVICWAIALVTLLRFIYLSCFFRRRPPLVRFHGRGRMEIDPASAASNPKECRHHLLTRLPLNEILQLEVSRWTLDMPRLPPTLDGLSIVHLSDTHFTGYVGKAYFREVVRVCNALQSDLVCITGDIIDRAKCLDWIPDTLGQLTARYGVYFILGNHDLCVDTDRLRQILVQCGLVDLGGRRVHVEINDRRVVLAGNERPWFEGWGSHTCLPWDRAAGCMPCADPSSPEHGDLRIVLAHSPDQFAWARQNHADLMLAGHTHGGQIRIPPLGAILTPTIEGVKYISGVFYDPPTILHVSRGLSGDVPVRWNCRPEVAYIRLCVAKPPPRSTARIIIDPSDADIPAG